MTNTLAIDEIVDKLLADGVPLMAEKKVDLARELSAMCARTPSGEVKAWPVVESVQRDGICVEAIAPAPGLDDGLASRARDLSVRVAEELGVTGVLAVELFETRDAAGQPEIFVNELAMRPHNTGHWTIDGAHTSQFENHLRAVLDLPLGDPRARDPWCMMVNVLGGGVDDLTSELLHCFARDPRLRVEFYGKQLRPGRKVGHVVCYGDDLDEVRGRAQHAARYLMGEIREG